MEAKTDIKPRLDKWLWAVRVFKTRSTATEACKKGKIFLNGIAAKASHLVKIGEVFELRETLITRSFKVTGLLEKRVSAKVAAEYMTEVTPPEEFKKLELARTTMIAIRERGAGRPTKKERRDIDKLTH
ncbi:MAG: RNA-binding S4 domain-containing protein [Acidobacteria bacterium]|jgi:ribosome-associated heat shock protein Hsp15|nr:RNA-binding S4 domain-containing protein [Acidobacteriota bacterium]